MEGLCYLLLSITRQNAALRILQTQRGLKEGGERSEAARALIKSGCRIYTDFPGAGFRVFPMDAPGKAPLVD
jgi:hypothetical protein